MKVRFWGVRGSIAVSGSSFVKTGGNTSCVEVEEEGHRLILDGGTGLRALGAEIGFQPIEATLLFSHVHWDHIQGVPFFTPAFHPGSKLTVAGAGESVREALSSQMKPPTFPVSLDAMSADIRYLELKNDQPFESGPFRIVPFRLDHPNGVLGFHIQTEHNSLVYATDVEHGERVDPRLIRHSAGADLLIHDAQYTPAEYHGSGGPSRVGWGHSAWTQAIETALRANVERLALFHHDPCRTDDGVDSIEDMARKCFTNAFAAREGLELAL
ncbi:MAG: MBL fold metallo-hydrolase [Proteobacteria bacterium]|jgi:phosphoribosyl 1,2-cyclic phosphodiesterase|nr:MBL fold metallo-hydrolase [Pseudomonadota bacterium]